MPKMSPGLTRRAVLAIGAFGLLAAGVAGCASGAGPAPAAQPSVSSTVFSIGAPAATTAPQRMTIAQARTKYSALSAPYNAAVAILNKDAKNGTTWTRFHSDLLAAVATNKLWEGEVRAVRWPAQVQVLIDSMLKSEVPAEISCDQSMADAASLQGAADVFSSDASCKDNTATADKVRRILGLPDTVS